MLLSFFINESEYISVFEVSLPRNKILFIIDMVEPGEQFNKQFMDILYISIGLLDILKIM